MGATATEHDGVRAATEMDDGALAAALLDLRHHAISLQAACGDDVAAVRDEMRPSAVNLLHYLALRHHDVRDLQRALAERGLSSLRRAEGPCIGHDRRRAPPSGWNASGRGGPMRPPFRSSHDLIAAHSVAALGPLPATDRVRLIVTVPSEAADDPGVIRDLVDAGMDLARINCAHAGPAAWQAMAATVRTEGERVGRAIGVAFDLASPKLRTGRMEPGPSAVRARPRRGVDGTMQRPAQARFVAADGPAPTDPHTVVVPITGDLVEGAVAGDEIGLRDARGRRRSLRISTATPGAVDATGNRTTYFATDTPLERRRDDAVVAIGAVGAVPATASFIRLERNDRLRRDLPVRRPAVLSADGAVEGPATIGCELSSVFDAVAVGHRVLIDHGSIEGVVDRVDPDSFDVVITRPDQAKLKGEKGINLPDTSFVAPALTADNRAALDVIAPLADLVSLSFVRSVDDVVELREALDSLARPDIAVGLKIEHSAAFAALPKLLLQACQRPPTAVMLARGDLAIEVGFERLAELQEEVLWLCEAAHVPVIWATQVVESLAKHGIPTRAEVTDAVSASRAECVMFNKGPHIVDALRFLDDVFARMHEHQDKRTSLLRRLSSSDAFDVPVAHGG
jgi:pyruvate kinase